MTGKTIIDEIFERAAVLALETRRPPSRIKVQAGDVTVELEWPGPAADGQAREPAPTQVAPVEPAASGADDGLVRICAPLVGTFYHAPGPGEPPFVRAGDLIEAGQQVGILEAMKLMNSIEADTGGRIVEVLVADRTAVEYGQPLIVLTPTGT